MLAGRQAGRLLQSLAFAGAGALQESTRNQARCWCCIWQRESLLLIPLSTLSSSFMHDHIPAAGNSSLLPRRINMKKKEGAAEGDSFLSRMGHTAAGNSGAAGAGSKGPERLLPLAPPPGQPAVAGGFGILPPPPASSSAAPAPVTHQQQVQQQQPRSAADDLLGLDFGAPVAATTAAAPSKPTPAAEEGWATFD